MAAGKTVVSRRLAQQLDRRFVDLDQVIETNQGLPIETIFSLKGEASFRAAEKEALKEVLERDNQVIALGGGTVVDPENLDLLNASGLLIWLKVSPQVVLKRIQRKDNRPLLQGNDKLQRIEELAAEREHIYAQADIIVETDNKPLERVVKDILDRLGYHPSPRE